MRPATVVWGEPVLIEMDPSVWLLNLPVRCRLARQLCCNVHTWHLPQLFHQMLWNDCFVQWHCKSWAEVNENDWKWWNGIGVLPAQVWQCDVEMRWCPLWVDLVNMQIVGCLNGLNVFQNELLKIFGHNFAWGPEGKSHLGRLVWLLWDRNDGGVF